MWFDIPLCTPQINIYFLVLPFMFLKALHESFFNSQRCKKYNKEPKFSMDGNNIYWRSDCIIFLTATLPHQEYFSSKFPLKLSICHVSKMSPSLIKNSNFPLDVHSNIFWPLKNNCLWRHKGYIIQFVTFDCLGNKELRRVRVEYFCILFSKYALISYGALRYMYGGLHVGEVLPSSWSYDLLINSKYP